MIMCGCIKDRKRIRIRYDKMYIYDQSGNLFNYFKIKYCPFCGQKLKSRKLQRKIFLKYKYDKYHFMDICKKEE